jgi:stearoyl-CoA desaturase (delta-9 desaturase)
MLRPADERINWRSSIPFVGVHLLPLLVVFTGVSARAVVLCVVFYWTRVFFITAGYHRYFSHRAYRMGRIPQFVMAFGGTTASQKGPLWWAAHHRQHHRASDTPADPHSPRKGFWWSHAGWILCDKYAATNQDRVRDLARYPELRFLERFDWIGPWALAMFCYLVAGWSGFLIGFVLSTVLVWHATFTVNSLAHVIGRPRYDTGDDSRNTALIAAITLGEGWHNNHHHFQSSARQGFFWWEIDLTYYALRLLAMIGVVHDLRTPPERVYSSDLNELDSDSVPVA